MLQVSKSVSAYNVQCYHPTNEQVVQMLLLTSMYLQGAEYSVATWNVHGLAVKAAYQLGLHSLDALQQYSLPEQELRKRVWYGCIMFDRYASRTGRLASANVNASAY